MYLVLRVYLPGTPSIPIRYSWYTYHTLTAWQSFAVKQGAFCRNSDGVMVVRVKIFTLTLTLTIETPINRAFQANCEGVRVKKEKNFFINFLI